MTQERQNNLSGWAMFALMAVVYLVTFAWRWGMLEAKVDNLQADIGQIKSLLSPPRSPRNLETQQARSDGER
jgi:hypothetical protein